MALSRRSTRSAGPCGTRLRTLAASTLALEGTLRSRDGLATFDSEGTLSGQDVRPGAALDGQLAGLARSLDTTLGGPLLSAVRQGLAREGQGSRPAHFAGFGAAAAAGADDPVSLVFAGRCRSHLADPPHAAWDGSFEPGGK